MLKKLSLLAFVSSLALATAYAELQIISTGHREAASFKRLSEYLTGKPSDGRYAAFRSAAATRDGYYISLLSNDKSLLSTVSGIKIHYYPTGEQDTQVAEFPVTQLSKKRILVGLTHSPYSEGTAVPAAWKIELLDDDARVIDSAQSFLWAEPDPIQ